MKRIAVVIMMLAAASAVAVAQISPDAVGGTGATNYIPLWTNSTTLGRSILFQNGLNVGLGTTAPLAKFQVSAATPLVTIKGLNTATTGERVWDRSIREGSSNYRSSNRRARIIRESKWLRWPVYKFSPRNCNQSVGWHTSFVAAKTCHSSNFSGRC
jgi:hypothetical protein